MATTTPPPPPKQREGLMTRATRVALYAAVVHAYWSPRETLQLLRVSDDVLLAHVMRFVLTIGTYCFAAAYVSWFFQLGAAIFLQSACWVLYISKERYLAPLGAAMGLALDVETEKRWLEVGASLCYAGLAWIIFFGGAAEERQQFRNRLVNFYTKHNPEKLAEVDELVTKYEGNEELLFTRLHRKYNALGAETASGSVPPGKRAVSREFDESAFLYEEEEEVVQFEDEQAQDADNEEESSANDRSAGGSSGGDSDNDNDGAFEVMKAPLSPPSVRRLSFSDGGDAPGTPTGGVAVTSLKSARVRAAIEEARRAQEQRVQQRIAQLSARADQH